MSPELNFPRFAAIGATISSNTTKYLRYSSEEGRLKFSEDDILKTPFTKFILETGGSDGLVHIRCSYNNKYLMKKSENDDWIVGAANEPEKQKSKWSCTLFRVVGVDAATNIYSFIHVQTGSYVGQSSSQTHPNCLQILRGGGAKPLVLVDMDTMVLLPKYVAFKGHNGYYLCDTWTDPNYGYNKFRFGSHEVLETRYEVVPFRDGIVRIKSLYYNVFWRRSPNWIWSDGRDDTNDKDTLFMPVKLDGNKIALKNLGNNHFCMSLTTEGKTDCLNAHTTEIRPEVELEVVEAVLRREIYDVNYQMKDARRYNMTTVQTLTKEVANEDWSKNPEDVSEGDVGFSYTESRKNTWNKTSSWSIGVSVEMSVGIPFTGQSAEVKIEGEYSGEYTWGEEKGNEKTISTSVTVRTPPRTKSVVTMTVQEGIIDIPFTYTQRNTLYNGRVERIRGVDGVFSSNFYEVKFDIYEQKI